MSPLLSSSIGQLTLTWNTPVDVDTVQMRRMQAKIQRGIERCLYTIAGIGALCGITWMMQLLFGRSLNALEQHPLLLGLWIGVLCGLMGYVNMQRRLRGTHTLPSALMTMSKKTTYAVDRCVQPEVWNALAQIWTSGAITPVAALDAMRRTSAYDTLQKRLPFDRGVLIDMLTRTQQTQEHRHYPIEQLLLDAAGEAVQAQQPYISPLSIVIACAQADPLIQEMFLELHITAGDLRHALHWNTLTRMHTSKARNLRTRSKSKPRSHMNRALTARPTPQLDRIGTDYTALARSNVFTPIVGREQELNDVFRILESRLGNILFVGEPGTGKSELLKAIASYMAAENVPRHLHDKRCVLLDPGRLIGSAEGIGGIESLFQSILQEVAAAGNIIIAIEDIHHLLGANSTNSSEDLGRMLMNVLSEGNVRVIATTTTDEYARFIQPVDTFARRFQVIRISELQQEDTLRVMEAHTLQLEDTYKVTFTVPALRNCYELCEQHLPDRRFPDKALQVLDESAALAREQRGEHTTVRAEDCTHVVQHKTAGAVADVTDGEADMLLHLEDHLQERIIDQDEAVHAVASALRRARTGLRSSNRPIATLLFLGPTGVGKTETAKAIAKLWFGSEKSMMRLDMSEYQTQESMERLLSGNGEGGQLLSSVQHNPHQLILLDEFEKAHPDLMNIFLQVFDDGRLTDRAGKTTNFCQTLIIATSNAGSDRIQQLLREGHTHDEMETILIEEELPTVLKPELLNRFDRLVIFRMLTQKSIERIATLMMHDLYGMLQKRGVALRVTTQALKELAMRGYHPRYGARAMRRTIQDSLEDPISTLFLKKDVSRRDTIVVRSVDDISVEKAVVL